MKLTKKAMALMLAGIMLFSAATVLAEDTVVGDTEEVILISAKPEAISPEVVTLEGFETADAWVAEEGTTTFGKDGIEFERTQKQMISYGEKKFDSEVLQFDFSIDFADGSNWGGFSFRGQSTNTLAWSGNYSYLVVVKQSQIELQRFNSAGNKFFAIVPNNGIIENNVKHAITLGSVEVAGGVQNFLFVDGKLVFNCFDGDETAITEPGYLSFYSGTKLTVSPYASDAEISSLPAGFQITGSAKDGQLTASHTTLQLGNELTTPVVKWGRNAEENGELSEIEAKGLADFAGKYNPVGKYPFVEGAEGDVYSITEEDENQYIAAFLTDADGTVLATSDAYFYDVTSAEKEKMIILLVDCEYAYVFGEKVQIDPDDPWVIPTVVNDRTLIPIRFISESLGAQVGWEEETETVTITQEETTIQMQLGKKEYTVNGETKEMDVEATTMRDRTMVPLRVISETFGKNVFWDDKGLIIISDEAPSWDSEKDAEIIDGIIEDIKVFE